jgi:histidine ammonia-lyase
MVIELSGTSLTAADVIAVARADARVVLGDEGRRAMEESAAVVASLAASDEPR